MKLNDYLAERCAEVLEWHRTGLLTDGYLRKLATSMPQSQEYQKLRAAEDKTAIEAMHYVLAHEQDANK